jgi:cell division protein FtsZ
MIELVDAPDPGARIKVIGAGGCGGNAVSHMIKQGLHGVDFIAVNTDSQALSNNAAPMRMQIGSVLTRGRGTGGNPEIGRKAALEDEERLREVLKDAEMVFVTAGMGGGTGTGSAPVLARIARETGALTVGVVTKPFQFEGSRRMSQADEGLRELKDAVDTLITIPNQRLLSIASRTTSLREAFQKADDVLLQAVRGGAARNLEPAAGGRLDQGRARASDQRNGRHRHVALRSDRSGEPDPGRGARGRQHHLRRGDRREAGR